MSPRTCIRSCVTWILVIVAGVAAPLLPASSVAQAAVLPAPPQVYLTTTYTPPTGQTIAVPAGGDFQAALNAANPGDVITLQAGATFTGPFTLPNKPGAGWIIVRSSAPDSALPPPGTRVDPSYASLMPKLVVSAEFNGAIQTAAGAHHFRFIGIEFHPTAGAVVRSLVRLGNGESNASLLPHDLIVDRCYIHGDPAVGGFRGIEMNSTRTAVIDSYISGFANTAWDAQAIWTWNGPGPFKIANDYLEGSGQSVMFGGQDAAIANLVPADIEIRGNHMAKPLSWRVGDPSYAGTHWVIKNLLELKNARRVLVDGNILEYTWPDNPIGQDGFAVLFTVRDQSGGAPWDDVSDITFTHNIVRHATDGVSVFGTDNAFASQVTHRVLVQNNLFYDIGVYSDMPHSYSPEGTWIVLSHGSPVDVTVDHNTAFQTSDPVVNYTYPGAPVDFTLTNNLTYTGPDGIAWASLGTGYVFDRNVIANGNAANYPPDNFFPSLSTPIVAAYYGGSDFSLVAGSPYAGAGTDGKDIGAGIGTLNTLTANVISGAQTTSTQTTTSSQTITTLPPPSLALTVQNSNFGSVAVGGSANLSFAVTNTGGSTLSGAASTAAPFSVASGGSFNLLPGASQTVIVRFSPTASGVSNGSVSFTSNGGAASQAVTGTGVRHVHKVTT